jgi:FkbM family methyltransferase
MNMSEAKRLYREGKILKPDFIDHMHKNHLLLNDYKENITNTEIKNILISANGVTITTKDDVILRCNFDDKTCVPLYALSFGGYESEESRIVLQLIEEEDVVFDIGANHGWYSLNIAKMYPHSKIYSFEPIKETFGILAENIKINGFQNISPFNIGVGKENSTMEFNYNKDMSGATSMANILERNDVEKITCNVCSLDSFVDDQKINKVDFIKCDIEGAELFALQGGKNILEQCRPKLFVEMLRKWAAKYGYHPNDIIRFMSNLGYQCFEIQNERLSHFEKMTDATNSTNFFFLHVEKHASTIESICPPKPMSLSSAPYMGSFL